jgi:hypothetical protein
MAEDKHMVAAHLAAAIIGRAPSGTVDAAVKTYRDVYVSLVEDENRRTTESMNRNRAGVSRENAAAEPKTYPDT